MAIAVFMDEPKVQGSVQPALREGGIPRTWVGVKCARSAVAVTVGPLDGTNQRPPSPPERANATHKRRTLSLCGAWGSVAEEESANGDTEEEAKRNHEAWELAAAPNCGYHFL